MRKVIALTCTSMNWPEGLTSRVSGLCSFIVLFTCIIAPTEALAQWVRLLHPANGIIGIFFLDQQGKPDVGFSGGMRSTDGGWTWRHTMGGGGADFAFKDSLTGWAGALGVVIKTTDGGLTWSRMPLDYGHAGPSVYY